MGTQLSTEISKLQHDVHALKHQVRRLSEFLGGAGHGVSGEIQLQDSGGAQEDFGGRSPKADPRDGLAPAVYALSSRMDAQGVTLKKLLNDDAQFNSRMNILQRSEVFLNTSLQGLEVQMAAHTEVLKDHTNQLSQINQRLGK